MGLLVPRISKALDEVDRRPTDLATRPGKGEQALLAPGSCAQFGIDDAKAVRNAHVEESSRPCGPFLGSVFRLGSVLEPKAVNHPRMIENGSSETSDRYGRRTKRLILKMGPIQRAAKRAPRPSSAPSASSLLMVHSCW
jgi:hypothetical protein